MACVFGLCHLVLVSVWQEDFIRGSVSAAKKPCVLHNLPLFSKLQLETEAIAHAAGLSA